MPEIFIWPLPESWLDDFVSVKCTKLLGLIIAIDRAVITSLWKTSGSSSLPSRLQLFRHCTALLNKDWSWWKEDRMWQLSYFKADFTQFYIFNYPDCQNWQHYYLNAIYFYNIFHGSMTAKFYFPERLLFYLVVVVGRATGVQAGEETLCLVLHTSRGWHGQEEGGQLQSCSLILFLFIYTDKRLRLFKEKLAITKPF